MKWLKQLFRHKFLVHITYKSGVQKAFWAYDFTIKNGEWNWDAAYQDNKPLLLGVDEIESVWQGEIRWFGRSIWFWLTLGAVICYFTYSAF